MVLFVGTGRCWSAGVRQGLEPLQGLGDQVCPGPVRREAEDAASSGGDELGGGGEQSESKPPGFPAADIAGQGEHRHPCEQVQGDLDDLQPDLVLRGVVEGQLRRPVARAARMRSSARARWRCLSSRDRHVVGVGGERGEPQAVGVGDPQLCAGVRPFLADDQSHPCRPSLEGVTGKFGDPGAVADLATWLDGPRPAVAGTCSTARWMGSVMVIPTEYDSHLPRWASQATNSWVPPPESVRMRVWRPRR